MVEVSIGLDGDQIMQRYLARRIYREIEFCITETDGTTHLGFITGFDTQCLQMSTSPAHEADEPHSVLIFWPIRRIEETGGRVDDLESDYKSKIRSYSHALRSQCEKALKTASSRGVSRVVPQSDEIPGLSDRL